ncbi:MAG: DUF3299 domain-containing protein [Gammaproteobacteria bacterium]
MRHIITSIIFMIFSLNVSASDYKLITWDHLIPETELEVLKKVSVLLSNPHLSMDMDVDLRREILIAQSQLEDPDVQGVMNSINVRDEFNNKAVRIPGFLVPVEMDDEGAITEFFLVPYFGACIHVPPPPPNQIIYVRYKKGVHVAEISIPYEIKGTLFTETIENDTAISAYTFEADEVIEYKEE